MKYAAGRRMSLASVDTVFLFNYRGAREDIESLVYVSGRREDSGQPKDGVRALHHILADALSREQSCLKIPKKVIIKMKGK